MKNKLIKTLLICLSVTMLVACGEISGNAATSSRIEKVDNVTEADTTEELEKARNEESANEESANEESTNKDSMSDDLENDDSSGKNQKKHSTKEKKQKDIKNKQERKEKKPKKVIRKLNKQTNDGEDIFRIRATLKEKDEDSFTIVDKNGTTYSITFDEAPNGYEDISINDKVQIDFTGELTEAEGLSGNILKISAGRRKQK